MVVLSELQKKAALVRKWCLASTTTAGSGHPTSCLSAADLMTVLFSDYFKYDIANPQNSLNDRLIFSKGHAAPLLYTLFALSGAFDPKELLTLRKLGSRLEGHPTPEFPYAEVATGSLGQGLSIGAGMAFALRAQVESAKLKVESLPRVYVLLGDGEMAEGSVWEAANFASYYKLNNLVAIVDVNRLGQSQETMFGDKVQEYVNRLSSFGWETAVIDGHNFEKIDKAFGSAVRNASNKPFVIVAKTKKGKGVSFLENKDGWHGKALKKEELEKVLVELGEIDESLRFSLSARGPAPTFPMSARSSLASSNELRAHGSPSRVTPRYELGQEIATREVYGQVLAQLGDQNELIYALDGDVKNSTFSQEFKKAHSDRFIECFIAEQNMVGVALGLAKRGKIPFVSTFAAFLTRGFDQIRMAAQSKANIKFVGSHAGVSIGEDGSSQMGLEDIAMFGAVPNSIILHPCDGVSTAKILPLMLGHSGISYLRTLRPKTPVIYKEEEKFIIGGSKILRQTQSDMLTVVVAGITVHEALKAYELLKKEGILVRIVDAYSIKPLDFKTLQQCVNETMKQWVITVEDHYEHGGLGDFVLSALSETGAKVLKMAVSKIPHSGTKDELLDFAGISVEHIVEKVKSLL